ncbi:hypothetical protein SAMN04487925_1026 [Bradyrhizobium sp. cf659]|nr:hypothetical protein SAMN04487925_1026 [Bradyrhizobium sp. cf659]
MRPIFNPSLVNGRCGDPTVYAETLFDLTTMAAGEIARQAMRPVEPFQFSPRYAGDEVRMLAEVMTAFKGSHA